MSHTNPSRIEKMDTYLDGIHLKLSYASMYPFVGTVPAAAKALIGVIEIVVASLFFVISLIPSLCSELGRGVLFFSAYHIVKGLIRTCVGVTLAVPILGTIFICGLFTCVSACGGIITFATDGDPESGENAGYSCILG